MSRSLSVLVGSVPAPPTGTDYPRILAEIGAGGDTASKSLLVGGSLTHGSQLTPEMTGFVGLGATQGDLQVLTPPARGYWRNDAPEEWALTTPYVYNNDLSNKGGVVPAGGMVIDGYPIAAGTNVRQFCDLQGGFYITSGPDMMFRGCAHRGGETAPGFLNCGAAWTGKVWIGYCSMGGLGAADAQYNEVPIKIAYNVGGGAIYRNYVTYTTTGIQVTASGFDIIENYIDKLTYFYGPGIPPGESTPKHLNGFTCNGGEASFRFLRNHVTLPTPDDAGREVNQTDAFSMFQDFGDFPGTGTNPADGSTGYYVRDNYLGGGGYAIYAGMNGGQPATSVQNLTFTGNRVTTNCWPNGGQLGPITAQPAWGSYGNTQSDNLWADGPNAALSFI